MFLTPACNVLSSNVLRVFPCIAISLPKLPNLQVLNGICSLLQAFPGQNPDKL